MVEKYYIDTESYKFLAKKGLKGLMWRRILQNLYESGEVDGSLDSLRNFVNANSWRFAKSFKRALEVNE